jgi:hypothetical protein
MIVVAFVLVVAAGWWLTTDREGLQNEPVSTGRAGFVATTDPDAKAPVFADEEAFSTSHEGLVARPSPTPGGGVYLDLQGRFQNAATATVNDSGEVEIECLPDSTDTGGER